MRRRGPRPLLLHLPSLLPLIGGTRSSSTFSPVSASLSAGWPSQVPAVPPEGIDAALIRGIAAYRRHPSTRTMPDPPVAWADGAARLLDYGRAGDLPVLFVPSLVNRAYILDLMPGQSMMRWLAERGVRPLLLDWGSPTSRDRDATLTDHVAGTLERAVAWMGEPVVLAGYCMGGMLAVAAAQRQPDRVRALALLATPWDFHAGHAASAKRLGAMLPALEPMLQSIGALPVDILQTLFASLDPGGIPKKFRAFGAMDQASDKAARFVALEDWLNDGIPLAAPVARETLGGWYGANTPARGEWRIAAEAVRPDRLRLPCFVAVPGTDRIVPPDSALALADLIPGAVVHRPASGHIGMAAGPRAASNLWTPLLDWLRRL